MRCMDELLQPFPATFASPSGDADVFVAASGEMGAKQIDRMHRHDFYELVLVWRGDCAFFSDFEQFDAPQGTIIFISPGQLHDYVIDEGVVRLLIFGFRPNLLPTVAAHLNHYLPFDDTEREPILLISAEYQPTFEQLFTTAHRRFDNRAEGWEAIVTTYLQTILTEAAWQMPAHIVTQSASAGVRLTRDFQRAVERNYREQQQVQAYAAMLGVTTNHLVKTVRKTTHMTPKQMLQARLLLEAKRLLAHTPYPVRQIGELLQFSDASSFSRWFKLQSRLTPSQFRKQRSMA